MAIDNNDQTRIAVPQKTAEGLPYFQMTQAAGGPPSEPIDLDTLPAATQTLAPPVSAPATIPSSGVDLDNLPSAELAFGHSAPIGVQTQVTRASNEAEINGALSQIYGTGNFGKENGTWWVMQDVPKERPKPQTMDDVRQQWNTPQQMERRRVPVFGGFLQTTEAQILAGGYPLAGGITGGIVGGTVGGPLGAAAGAFVGGAAGKAVDEGIKWWQNFYRKTPSQALAVTLGEGAVYGAFEGIGPLAKYAAGEPTKRLLKWWTGVTPQGTSMAQKLHEEGARVPIGVLAPEAKTMQYDVMIRNLLTGDPKSAANIRYLGERMTRLMQDQGVTPADAARVVQEITDRTFAVSSRDADEAANMAVQRYLGNMRSSMDSNINAAQTQLRAREQAIRQWVDAPAGNLAADVQEGIVRARRDFSQRMQRAAEDVHNMEPGEIVPIWPVYDRAATMANELRAADQAVPGVIDRLAQRVDNPDARQLTIAEAHLMRTELRRIANDMFDSNPLAPGPAWRRMHELANEVDDVFTGLAESGEPGERAANALRQFDVAYRQGMQRFNDAEVGKLASLVRRRLPVDPDHVATMVFQPGHTAVAREVWAMFNPSVQERVAQAYMRNLLQKSTNPLTNQLDGKTFARVLSGEGELLNVPFAPQAVRELQNLARDLAAIDATVANPWRALGPDASSSQVRQMLTDARNQAVAIDNFARTHPLRALASGDAYAIDRAADTIISPQREAGMEDVFKFLTPAEQKIVQDYALKKLLSSAIVDTPWKAGSIIGSKIDAELRKYTSRQQDLLFPGGLGEDLRELARDARFLFPFDFAEGGKDFGGSLHAANIKAHMPFTLVPYLKSVIIGTLIESPPMIRMLAGLKKMDKNYTSILARRILRYIAISKLTGQTATGPGLSQPQGQPLIVPSMNFDQAASGGKEQRPEKRSNLIFDLMGNLITPANAMEVRRLKELSE